MYPRLGSERMQTWLLHTEGDLAVSHIDGECSVSRQTGMVAKERCWVSTAWQDGHGVAWQRRSGTQRGVGKIWVLRFAGVVVRPTWF
jgi:hypothetical protein